AEALHTRTGRSVAQHAGIPVDRHALPAADHPGLHHLVLLGVSRQGEGRHRLSLKHRTESKDRVSAKCTADFGQIRCANKERSIGPKRSYLKALIEVSPGAPFSESFPHCSSAVRCGIRCISAACSR